MASTPETAGMSTEQRAFHMAEFDKLKSEIAELIKSAAQMFNFAVVTSGALFAWLLTAKVSADLPKVSFAIPALLTLVFAAMAYAQAERIKQMGTYLHDLEERLGLPELGWEKHFRKKGAVVGHAMQAAWTILFAGDVAVAYLLTR